jgi:predicted MFS family arabinose efflux permease
VVSEAPVRAAYRDAFASREFRMLFSAQAVSVTGTSVAAVALTIVVYRRTGSSFLASLTFALGFAPYVLGGGLLSSVVDRVRPRRLVAGCNLLATVLAAAMAWPAMPVSGLLALLLAIGALQSVASGAGAALLRSTVSHDAYVPARSLMRIAAQGAQIGGNAVGGSLLVLLSPSGALLVNAGSFAVSATVVRLAITDYPNAGEAVGAMVIRDSLRGLRAVWAERELRRLLLVGWAAPMFWVAPEALAAPYVAHHHGSPAVVGWWLVALPVGVIAGDVAGVRLLSLQRQRRLVGPAAAASFLPYLVFALDPSIPVAVALLAVSGLCGFYALGLDARIRDAAPARLFARAMTINSAGLMTLQGAGFALAGALAQATGPAGAVAVSGACGLIATITLLGSDFRRQA